MALYCSNAHWESLCVLTVPIVLHLESMFVGEFGEGIDEVLLGWDVLFSDALPFALRHKSWSRFSDVASKVVVVEMFVAKHDGHTF